MPTAKVFSEIILMNNLQSQLSSFLFTSPYILLTKLQSWVRREIVADDPWDQETLFSHEVFLSEQEEKVEDKL